MKKLLLLSTCYLSFFNYNVQAMDDPSNEEGTPSIANRSTPPIAFTQGDTKKESPTLEEIKKTLEKHAPAPITISEVILGITRDDLKLLPGVMRTSKEWNVATQDLWRPIGTFFQKIYQGKDDLKTFFKIEHAYKNKMNWLCNKEAFKAGFRKIVLGIGTEEREGILLPTAQIIRDYCYTNGAKFPDELQKAYPTLFTSQPPSKPLQFNYLTIFQLDAAQSQVPAESVETSNNCLKQLSAFIKAEKPDDDFYQYTFNKPYKPSLFTFLKVTSPKTTPHLQGFDPFRQKMVTLYKMALIKQGYADRFYAHPPSYPILEDTQKVPVPFGADMKMIEEQATIELLDLAKQRWDIVEQSRFLFSIG